MHLWLNKITNKVGFPKYWLYFLLEHNQINKQSKHITTKVFIKLQFLQKLSSQKSFWDEARLSSLVNKRFAEREPLPLFILLLLLDQLDHLTINQVLRWNLDKVALLVEDPPQLNIRLGKILPIQKSPCNFWTNHEIVVSFGI